jgi:hypothetical protein
MLLMSGEMRPRPSRGPFWTRVAQVTIAAALVTFVSTTAAAQATAPGAQPPPPLEAGDTAPPPGAAPAVAPAAGEPVTPLGSPAGTAPGLAAAPAPAAVAAPLVMPPAPHTPFYRRKWFVGAASLLVVTGIVLLALTLANQDPPTPNTRLGDMRAF